jgi:hypothetical protein
MTGAYPLPATTMYPSESALNVVVSAKLDVTRDCGRRLGPFHNRRSGPASSLR